MSAQPNTLTDEPRILVGPELEGGQWPDCASTIRINDFTVKTGCDDDGEVRPSAPLTLTKAKPWIIKHYPGQVNETCGFHVHMSFGADQTGWLIMLADFDIVKVEFFDYFLAEAERFGNSLTDPIDSKRFLSRLKGCRSSARRSNLRENFCGTSQTKADHLSWHSIYNTVEVRVAPMFSTSVIAVEYLEWLVNLFKKFFKDNGPLSPEEIEGYKKIYTMI